MSSRSNDVIISLRIPRKLSESFDRLNKLMKISKSDFIRACIEKLCKDNQIYLKYAEKVKEYIQAIKSVMSKVSSDKIILENGSWETASNEAILMLCDLFLRYSDKVFDTWFKILVDFGLADENQREKAREDTIEGLIEIEDIGFILSKTKAPIEVEELIVEEFWWDQLETKRISLLLAMKRSLEKFSAEALINEVIAKTSKIEKEKTIIVVDAKGEFKRSGSVIITPVEYETISKIKRKTEKR